MEQVFRCFVEKRPGFQVEAENLLRDLREQLGIQRLTGLRLFHRYDAQGLSQEIYNRLEKQCFPEPMVDQCWDETLPELGPCTLLAVEALPGQFRSAGGFLRPVHRYPHLWGTAAGGCRHGLCPLRGSDPRGRG